MTGDIPSSSPRSSARVLVADPPWPFRDRLPGAGRGAAKHYGLMTFDDIKRFPLPPLDPTGSWLFLWRVASMQAEALEVAAAWGFTPKAEVVWVKTTKDGNRPRIGMGHYVRHAHETCLVAVKGRPQQLSNNVLSVLMAPRGLHSQKPDAFYELVEALAPGPYVELFARQRRGGWDCRGDEVLADSAQRSQEPLPAEGDSR